MNTTPKAGQRWLYTIGYSKVVFEISSIDNRGLARCIYVHVISMCM